MNLIIVIDNCLRLVLFQSFLFSQYTRAIRHMANLHNQCSQRFISVFGYVILLFLMVSHYKRLTNSRPSSVNYGLSCLIVSLLGTYSQSLIPFYCISMIIDIPFFNSKQYRVQQQGNHLLTFPMI